MRTLRRPMFRGGSTGTGITSGLAPKRGRVDGPGGYAGETWRDRKISDIFSGQTTFGEAQDLSKALSYSPRGTNVYDFLTEFGLNIASTPPQGNIISTAAVAAKEPYQRFLTKKSEAETAKYVSEADMFKTLIEGAAEAQGEGGAEWQKQWELQQIGTLMDTISGLKELEGRTPTQDLELSKAEEKLAKIKAKDPAVDWFLGTGADVGADKLFKKIKADLYRADPGKYNNSEDHPDLIADTFVAFKKYISELKAEGGRVGYANAGPVMGQPTQADVMPEELGGVSYEELRARLPQEVSDEVVRLLANSPEALEDFAVIQTEQDIANFNKKYGVNLVLPAEA